MGVMTLLLWLLWIGWSYASKNLKGQFAAHFDVYYLTHMILPVGVIFMLLGYRYVYSDVPDDYFDSPPTIVPALKLAYFQKIMMLQFILLPLVAIGIGKGFTMLGNMFPIDIHKIRDAMKPK
jgi:hypothetical protein